MAKDAIVNEVVHVSMAKDVNFMEDVLPINIQQEVGHHGSTPEPDFCIKAVKARKLKNRMVAIHTGTLSVCRLDETDNVGVTIYEVRNER